MNLDNYKIIILVINIFIFYYLVFKQQKNKFFFLSTYIYCIIILSIIYLNGKYLLNPDTDIFYKMNIILLIIILILFLIKIYKLFVE